MTPPQELQELAAELESLESRVKLSPSPLSPSLLTERLDRVEAQVNSIEAQVNKVEAQVNGIPLIREAIATLIDETLLLRDAVNGIVAIRAREATPPENCVTPMDIITDAAKALADAPEASSRRTVPTSGKLFPAMALRSCRSIALIVGNRAAYLLRRLARNHSEGTRLCSIAVLQDQSKQ